MCHYFTAPDSPDSIKQLGFNEEKDAPEVEEVTRGLR